jgi:peptidyl-dipeptidase Dcp
VEYLAAAILDMAWHSFPAPRPDIDVNRYESEIMSSARLMPEIVPRYRSTYFTHIFSGGYSAGYYVYIWAEQLDADAFEAFRENGLFDRGTAAAFRRNVLERYGTGDLMTQYKAFRGAAPKIEPLLKRRGLLP